MSVSKQQFLEALATALNEDPKDVREDVSLADLAGWDSVGQLAVIATIDEMLGKSVNVDKLRSCEKIGDLVGMFLGGADQ
jgi:acyl carrier protein